MVHPSSRIRLSSTGDKMNVIAVAEIASRLSNEDLMVLLVMLKDRIMIWDNNPCHTCGGTVSICHDVGSICMNGSVVQMECGESEELE